MGTEGSSGTRLMHHGHCSLSSGVQHEHYIQLKILSKLFNLVRCIADCWCALGIGMSFESLAHLCEGLDSCRPITSVIGGPHDVPVIWTCDYLLWSRARRMPRTRPHGACTQLTSMPVLCSDMDEDDSARRAAGKS